MKQGKNSPSDRGLTRRLSSQKWPSVEAMFRMVQKTNAPDVMPVDHAKVQVLKFLNEYVRHGLC